MNFSTTTVLLLLTNILSLTSAKERRDKERCYEGATKCPSKHSPWSPDAGIFYECKQGSWETIYRGPRIRCSMSGAFPGSWIGGDRGMGRVMRKGSWR